MSRFIPPWPAWALIPAAIVFSMVNAALEEAAYRGVVLEALDAVLGAGASAVVLQAVAFAALHFRDGFPRGAVGVGLAFVYGIVLGALRRRAGGLVVPWSCCSSIQSCWAKESASLQRGLRHAHSSSPARKLCPQASLSTSTRPLGL